MPVITKENIEELLFQFAKRLKKQYGRKFKAELVLVGGAAILTKHHFRQSTIDIDVATSEISSYKDIVRQMADEYNLPDDWLNSDFTRTESYSPKLIQYSKFYREYAQVLKVYAVDDLCLICMKLKSFRYNSKDIFDLENLLNKNKYSFKEIVQRMDNLYHEGLNIRPEAEKYLRSKCSQSKDSVINKMIDEYEWDEER